MGRPTAFGLANGSHSRRVLLLTVVLRYPENMFIFRDCFSRFGSMPFKNKKDRKVKANYQKRMTIIIYIIINNYNNCNNNNDNNDSNNNENNDK